VISAIEMDRATWPDDLFHAFQEAMEITASSAAS
jgi:hypothetical protein